MMLSEVIAEGIIPARAGFTERHKNWWTWFRDHPRSRGVYPVAGTSVPSRRGSSPLARGLPTLERSTNDRIRIIPARAGFTPPIMLVGRPSYGSSPLARGLHVVRGLGGHLSRIIPARAGFTSSLTICWGSGRDHPRSRGVYIRTVRGRVRSVGSSPLARGLHYFIRPRRVNDGIIPARAGFTPRRGHTPTHGEDHPRSRGVYRAIGVNIHTQIGSSPLARGLHIAHAVLGHDDRIIPARAGFTPRAREDHNSWPDHPRSRGVYGPVPRARRHPHGSSPLARGLLDDLAVARAFGGIIPARAGFT